MLEVDNVVSLHTGRLTEVVHRGHTVQDTNDLGVESDTLARPVGGQTVGTVAEEEIEVPRHPIHR